MSKRERDQRDKRDVPKKALDITLDELERVTAEWRKSELISKDFQIMLGRICRRHDLGLPITNRHIKQAMDLIRRKGTLSLLRDSH